MNNKNYKEDKKDDGHILLKQKERKKQEEITKYKIMNKIIVKKV
jgi:hypothetical protein